MPKRFRKLFFYFLVVTFSFAGYQAYAAKAAAVPGQVIDKSMTLWDLLTAAGFCVIPLTLMSILAGASILYHFMYVTPEKLVPQDFIENVLTLLEKKQYDKAASISKTQSNLISPIVLKGLEKMSKGKLVVEEAMQYEGKARIERLWQNLTYLGDIAVIAPMLGLLGTIFGMIDAFNYFKVGTINPVVLTQGLAKAMINTAFGLVIAVPALMFYSYFRGKVSRITAIAESTASEVMHAIVK